MCDLLLEITTQLTRRLYRDDPDGTGASATAGLATAYTSPALSGMLPFTENVQALCQDSRCMAMAPISRAACCLLMPTDACAPHKTAPFSEGVQQCVAIRRQSQPSHDNALSTRWPVHSQPFYII